MSIKVKLRANKKAIVRFNDKIDEQFFVHIMRMNRDDGMSHPKISVKSITDEEFARLGQPIPMPNKPTMIPNLPPPGQPVVQDLKPSIVQPSVNPIIAKTGNEVKQDKEAKK